MDHQIPLKELFTTQLSPLSLQFRTQLPPLAPHAEDFWLTDEVRALILEGAARRGYPDPMDYLADLVEAIK